MLLNVTTHKEISHTCGQERTLLIVNIRKMARINTSGNSDNDEHDEYNSDNDNERVDEMSGKF